MAFPKIKKFFKPVRFPLILAIIILALPFLVMFIYGASREWKKNSYDSFLSRPVKVQKIIFEPGKPFTNSAEMKFVHIPPGRFTMGSPDDELGRSEFEFQHTVVIKNGFYLQATEVTQKQWTRIMGKNPSKIIGDNHPVEKVSWLDAQKFIFRLNQIEGVKKYRFPTEAEWEYAARAGAKSAFSSGGITATGSDYDPNLDRMGWYRGNSGKTSHPVAQKEPNAWGLYDMHGNVWEWCQDWFAPWGIRFPDDAVLVDPKGPQKGRFKIFRGGSWFSGATSHRAADRMRLKTDNRSYGIGFRVARSE